MVRRQRRLCADSRDIDAIETCQVDLVFSCPPYADLEVYSDDPRDISNMDYEAFVAAYREIIAKACAKLKDNRFAVFVVGDVRDRKGFYRNFVGDIRRIEHQAQRVASVPARLYVSRHQRPHL